jgi:hypothetical protein
VEKYLELATKKLGSGDAIARTWPGFYKGTRGYIVLSKKKLQFITEKGTFRKVAEQLLDVGYDQISGVEEKNKDELVLTDDKGVKHVLTSELIANVHSMIEDQKKQIVPEVAPTVSGPSNSTESSEETGRRPENIASPTL